MARNTARTPAVVVIGFLLAIPGGGESQQGQPSSPDFSILYWYDRTDPEGTVKFQVYDNRKAPYPAAAVREWMAKNHINEPDSKWRGSPHDAPVSVYLSRFDGIISGRMTEPMAIETVMEGIRRDLRLEAIRHNTNKRSLSRLEPEARNTSKAGPVERPRNADESIKLQGTRWSGQYSVVKRNESRAELARFDRWIDLRFEPNDKCTLEIATSPPRVYHGTYHQDGQHVSLSGIGGPSETYDLNRKYLIYKGQVLDFGENFGYVHINIQLTRYQY